jgi:hypothetical protein
LEDRREH